MGSSRYIFFGTLLPSSVQICVLQADIGVKSNIDPKIKRTYLGPCVNISKHLNALYHSQLVVVELYPVTVGGFVVIF